MLSCPFWVHTDHSGLANIPKPPSRGREDKHINNLKIGRSGFIKEPKGYWQNCTGEAGGLQVAWVVTKNSGGVFTLGEQGTGTQKFLLWLNRLRSQHNVHADAGWIPDLDHWVKDPSMPHAAV